MKRKFIAAVIVGCIIGATSVAISGGDEKSPPADMGGDAPAMEQPTAEHLELKNRVGNWKSEMSFEMGDQKMVATGTSTIKMMGGFWAIEESNAEMMGFPMQGHGMYGYDAIRKKHIIIWADSGGSWVMHMEGDKQGDKLVVKCEGPDMMNPKMTTTYEMEETWPDADTRQLIMNSPGKDGKMTKFWTQTAKRVK